jgi:hypothetical protein
VKRTCWLCWRVHALVSKWCKVTISCHAPTANHSQLPVSPQPTRCVRVLLTDTDKSTKRTNILSRSRLPNRRDNPQSRLHRRNLTRRLRSSSPVPIDDHQFSRIRRTKHQVLRMRLKSRRGGKDGRFKVSVLRGGSRESGSSTDGAVKREIRFQLKHRPDKTIQLQAVILPSTPPGYWATLTRIMSRESAKRRFAWRMAWTTGEGTRVRMTFACSLSVSSCSANSISSIAEAIAARGAVQSHSRRSHRHRLARGREPNDRHRQRLTRGDISIRAGIPPLICRRITAP